MRQLFGRLCTVSFAACGVLLSVSILHQIIPNFSYLVANPLENSSFVKALGQKATHSPYIGIGEPAKTDVAEDEEGNDWEEASAFSAEAALGTSSPGLKVSAYVSAQPSRVPLLNKGSSNCVCRAQSCTVPALGRMLRVCFEHDEALAYKWEAFLKASKSKKNGMTLANAECVQLVDAKSCSKIGLRAFPIDVILTEHTSVERLLDLLNPSGKVQHATGGAWVVLAERYDGSSLRHRRLLKYKRLAAYMKEYVPRDRRLLNSHKLGQKGRLHYGILCSAIQWQNRNCKGDETVPPPSVRFSSEELSKVVPASWNWGQYHIYLSGALEEVASEAHKLFKQPKDACDLFLATHSRPNLDGHFRQIAIDASSALAGKPMPHRPKGPKLCIHQSKLSFKDYSRIMARSQATLCPWGMGERTACDEHAILVGAVLLKPNTDFVEGFPDVYEDGKNYLALLVDFSDLGEKLARILEDKNGEITKMRQRSFHILRDTGRTAIAQDFWSKLRHQVGKASNGDFQKPMSNDTERSFSASSACENPVALKKWSICT